MFKIIRAAAIISAATVAMVGSATAAMLDGINGTVMVNTGAGFVQVTSPRQLKAGDMVMVSGNGAAVIIYEKGCLTHVQSGKVQAVLDEVACAAGQQASSPASASPGAGAASSAVAGGLPTGAVIAGVAAAGGVAYLIAKSASSP